MHRVLLKVFLALALLVVIAVSGLSLLIANIDLNRLKPDIQEALYQQSGIILAIDGAIDWTFEWQGLPSLSLTINNTHAYSPASNKPTSQLETIVRNQQAPFADIQQIIFGVVLSDLLHGQVTVNELTISDAAFYLLRDKTGKGNWETINPTPPEIAKQESDSQSSSLFTLNAVVIDSVQLKSISLSYHNELSGLQQTINIQSLKSDGVNLQGESFSVNLQAVISNSELNQDDTQKSFALDFNSHVSLIGFLTVDEHTLQQIVLSNIRSELKQLRPSNTKKSLQAIKVKGDATYRLNDHAFTIDNFRLENDDSQIHLTLNGVPSIDNKTRSLNVSGKMDLSLKDIAAQLNAMNIKTPETKNTFKNLTLKAEVSGLIQPLSQRFSLANINATFDKSNITGAASILLRNEKAPTISTLLNIDTLNIDRYTSTNNSQKTTSIQAPALLPIPLEQLDFVDILATINIENLIVNQLQFTSLATGLEVADGDIKQAIVKGKFYQSIINTRASLSRSHQSIPKIDIQQTLVGLDIAALSKAINLALDNRTASTPAISGVADIEASLQLQGDNLDAWQKSLTGITELTLANGVYTTDNIEYRVCQAVALARNTRLQKDWPNDTALETVSTSIIWNKGIGELTALKGGLKNIDLVGAGTIDLLKQSYRLDLDGIIKGAIVDDTTESTRRDSRSDSACAINDKYRHIAWPIKCSGVLSADANLQKSGCAVNQQRLRGLIKTAAKKEVQNKLKDVIDKELNKHLGDGVENEFRDLIKGGLEGLFK